MSVLFRRSADLEAFRPPLNSEAGHLGNGAATAKSSLRVGAMWAALRLRSDLISTLPWKPYREVGGRAIEVPKPPMLIDPSAGWLWNEWMYATQFDIDRFGNVFGFVAAVDGAGRPAQVELTDTSEWSVVGSSSSGAWEYQHKGVPQPKASVWHERQYVVPGIPLGLSPSAHAAWATGHFLSAQQFALDWFQSGASPAGVLRNRAKVINPDEANTAKARFRAAISRRDIFVTGSDWEDTPSAAAASDAKFIDAMKYSVSDICRFIGVPGDMIDAESSTGSITYANVNQRNLQLLTVNLGPAIARREAKFSRHFVANPRYIRANTDAILRMDAKGKLEVLTSGVKGHVYTHDEARALLELPPLTDEQIAKTHQIEGTAPSPGTKTGVPA